MTADFPPTIYVLGTDRNIGKTVTCMGIISNLASAANGIGIQDIGYIKPVGQQTLTVVDGRGVSMEADKDAVLATSLMGITGRDYRWLSPVVWADGVTAQYIDQASEGDPFVGREAFLDRIREAYAHVAEGRRVVLAEGTGQPGVGSVAGISNADVINALREMGVPLYVILVTRGGIGSTIDQVFPYLMLLDHMGARAGGLVINDVYTSKMDKIRHYLSAYYDRVFLHLYGRYLSVQEAPRILGFIPAIEDLRLPTIRLVAETLAHKGQDAIEIIAPDTFAAHEHALVRNVRVISLDFGFERFVQPGDAVVVGVNSNDTILAILLLHERMMRQTGKGLSGLLLSCKQVGGLNRQIEELVETSDLPTMLVALDSASILHDVESMTVKIQPYDQAKRALIAEAFRENLTLWPELVS